MISAPLGDVASINPRSDSIPTETKVSFVGMAELDAATASARPRESRSFGEVSKGYTVFRNRDILAAKITPCWENGKVAQAKLEHPIGVGSTEFHVIRPGDALDERYLLHFLRQSRIRLGGEAQMTGSGGQKRVPASYLKSLDVPMPTIVEQRRIAAILDRADAVRATRRQALAHLDALQESVFTDFFQRPPDGWARLDDLAERVVVGHVGPTTEFFRPTGVPFLRTGNVGRGEIVRDGLAHVTPDFHLRLKKSQILAGDVILSRVITDEVRAAVVPEDLDGANCANIIVVRPSDQILSTTVLGYVSRAQTQRRLLGRRVGSAQGVVNTTVLKELSTPLYSVEQQLRLSARVTAVSAQRAARRRALRADDELFHSLQARAFRGEL